MSEQENKVQENTQEEPNVAPKNSKGEKKFRKAMCKMGLKPVEGVNRVTIKTNKGMFLYIDNPEVMKSEGGYLIFGETKFLNMNEKPAETANNFDSGKEPKDKDQNVIVEEANEDENDDVTEEIGDLKEDDIENLMTYNNISRNKAIRVLRKAGGDLVEAISLLDSN